MTRAWLLLCRPKRAGSEAMTLLEMLLAVVMLFLFTMAFVSVHGLMLDLTEGLAMTADGQRDFNASTSLKGSDLMASRAINQESLNRLAQQLQALPPAAMERLFRSDMADPAQIGLAAERSCFGELPAKSTAWALPGADTWRIARDEEGSGTRWGGTLISDGQRQQLQQAGGSSSWMRGYFERVCLVRHMGFDNGRGGRLYLLQADPITMPSGRRSPLLKPLRLLFCHPQKECYSNG